MKAVIGDLINRIRKIIVTSFYEDENEKEREGPKYSFLVAGVLNYGSMHPISYN